MVSYRRKLGGPRPAMVFLLRWLLLACAVTLAPAIARGQTQWEFSPYEIRLAIVMAPETNLNVDDWGDQLQSRAAAVVGAVWRLQLETPPEALRHALLAGSWPPEISLIPEPWLAADKVILLAVTDRERQLTAMELDVATRIWSPRLQARVDQPQMLDSAARQLMLEVFSPLARIEDVSGATAKLRIRGGSLPPRDPDVQLLRPEDYLIPVMRFLDREGIARRITPLDWTFLQVQEVAGPAAESKIYSGLRSPLSARTRGRVERLALAIPRFTGTTQLQLHLPGESAEPLVGYSVYSHAPEVKQTELLGKTDRQGMVTIPAADSFLRILLVKHGDEILARLPLIPGLYPRLTAELPADDDRLYFEGVVIGLQESLVDLVSRREVLIGRVRGLIEAGKLEEAGELISQLRDIRNQQERFMLGLEEKRRQVRTNDPRMRARVERLFGDTKNLMAQYFDEGPLNRLEADYAEARRNAQ